MFVEDSHGFGSALLSFPKSKEQQGVCSNLAKYVLNSVWRKTPRF